jgi:sucrose phosphorylase
MSRDDENSPSRIEADVAYRRRHSTTPDYARPVLQVPETDTAKIKKMLLSLYGEDAIEEIYAEVVRIMRVYYAHKSPRMILDDSAFAPEERFTERDVILITYGDLILSEGEPPLRVLSRILTQYFNNITTIHLLPFFPYSSDRGFSVTDFEEVDSRIGTWEDVEALADRYELMFDGVINHVSSQSRWFQEFLDGNPDYQDVFTCFSTRDAVSQDHLRMILRPRSSDLLTPYRTLNGMRYVWTTFSRDQVDLNYRNPRVFLRVLAILLHYVRRGADLIRLDAVTYLWSELGTSSAHLWQTHSMIQLIRAVLNVVAPRVALISETNVPHKDNISYFGDGANEAQMVYNFALPPLVLLTFQTGDCSRLSQWAAGLEKVSDTATYFNFLDSHDGIGLLGIRGIVPTEEIDAMIARAKEHGGLVSYRTDEEGNRSPYEINITWWNAINREEEETPDTLDREVNRFVASRCLALVLRGVPGIYIVGMVGGKNDFESVEATGEARSINRRVVDASKVRERLQNPDAHTSRVFRRMNYLLGVRAHNPAFHPTGDQKVLLGNSAVFAVCRVSPDGSKWMVALVNVTGRDQEFEVKSGDLDLPWPTAWRDTLSGRSLASTADAVVVPLTPYEVLWLEPVADGTEGGHGDGR